MTRTLSAFSISHLPQSIRSAGVLLCLLALMVVGAHHHEDEESHQDCGICLQADHGFEAGSSSPDTVDLLHFVSLIPLPVSSPLPGIPAGIPLPRAPPVHSRIIT